MGHRYLAPGGAMSRKAAVQKRHPLRDIAIFDPDPPAKDRSHCMPEGKTLLSCQRNELAGVLIHGCIGSGQGKKAAAVH